MTLRSYLCGLLHAFHFHSAEIEKRMQAVRVETKGLADSVDHIANHSDDPLAELVRNLRSSKRTHETRR